MEIRKRKERQNPRRGMVQCLLLTVLLAMNLAAAPASGGRTPSAAVEVCAAAVGPGPSADVREGQAAEAGREDVLSIEVIEELSIDDEIIIEDEEVPLAAFSDGSVDAGPRRAAMMGLVLLCVIGHTVYFDRREKRLFELRREAARARQKAGRTGA